MKKVYDTVGFFGIGLMFLAACLSDSGAITFGQTVVLGALSAILMLFALSGINAAEFAREDSKTEIEMIKSERLFEKSA